MNHHHFHPLSITKEILVAGFSIGMFFTDTALLAQSHQHSPQEIEAALAKSDVDVDKVTADMLRAGIVPEVARQLAQKHQRFADEGRPIRWSMANDKSRARIQPNPAPNAICAGLGVENGWGAWTGDVGEVSHLPNVFNWNVPPLPVMPGPPNFTLHTSGTIPCTPGPAPPPAPNNGPISCVPPTGYGFGTTAFQLGENRTPQASSPYGAEQLLYPITVTPQDTNFIYAYAILIQDPIGNDHANWQRPYASFCIYDSLGNALPCACFTYVGGPNPTQLGFYPAAPACDTYNNIFIGQETYYKPWTIVGVNLKPYIGQTLTVEIMNVDCRKGGHFVQSYWDFSCGTIDMVGGGSCAGGTTSICAPSDPAINYTYQWYQNGTPYTPGGTSMCINPTYQPGDTFVVEVKQPSGCNFKLVYVAQASGSITAVINPVNPSCAPNGSATANPNGGNAPYTYSWSNGQNTQTATNLAAGTYSVTITDAAGCTGTATVTLSSSSTFTVSISTSPVQCNVANGSASANVAGGNPPFMYNWSSGQATQTASNLGPGNYTVTITDASGCMGTATVSLAGSSTFSLSSTSSPALCSTANGSASIVPAGGAAPFTFLWNTSPVQTGSSASALLPGTYAVIVTDGNGCTNTDTIIVMQQNSNPVAAFTPSAPCLGNSTQLSDGSVSPGNDPIVSWNWMMNGGNPASSSAQNPSTVYSTPGAHSVTLAVTTQNGCIDTVVQQILVYHAPVVNFIGAGAGCLPVCTNFSDLSASTDGSIIAWNWSFPGGTPSSSTAQHPQNICYSTAGSYNATLVVTTSYGCTAVLSMPAVEAYPWPNADFCVSDPVMPATNPVFSFCDLWSQDVTSWAWNFGDNSPVDSMSTDPVHSYSTTAAGNDFYAYDICLRVENQYGCWDTTCKTVELKPEFTFYIPNSFTPNGDLSNETFFGKGRGIKEYSIWLFDRWGNMIWDCQYQGENTHWDEPGKEGMPSACKWDGKVKVGGLDMSGGSGQLVQEDVYVWKVVLIDIFERQHNYVGHVSVVK